MKSVKSTRKSTHHILDEDDGWLKGEWKKEIVWLLFWQGKFEKCWEANLINNLYLPVLTDKIRDVVSVIEINLIVFKMVRLVLYYSFQSRESVLWNIKFGFDQIHIEKDSQNN